MKERVPSYAAPEEFSSRPRQLTKLEQKLASAREALEKATGLDYSRPASVGSVHSLAMRDKRRERRRMSTPLVTAGTESAGLVGTEPPPTGPATAGGPQRAYSLPPPQPAPTTPAQQAQRQEQQRRAPRASTSVGVDPAQQPAAQQPQLPASSAADDPRQKQPQGAQQQQQQQQHRQGGPSSKHPLGGTPNILVQPYHTSCRQLFNLSLLTTSVHQWERDSKLYYSPVGRSAFATPQAWSSSLRKDMRRTAGTRPETAPELQGLDRSCSLRASAPTTPAAGAAARRGSGRGFTRAAQQQERQRPSTVGGMGHVTRQQQQEQRPSTTSAVLVAEARNGHELLVIRPKRSARTRAAATAWSYGLEPHVLSRLMQVDMTQDEEDQAQSQGGQGRTSAGSGDGAARHHDRQGSSREGRAGTGTDEEDACPSAVASPLSVGKRSVTLQVPEDEEGLHDGLDVILAKLPLLYGGADADAHPPLPSARPAAGCTTASAADVAAAAAAAAPQSSQLQQWDAPSPMRPSTSDAPQALPAAAQSAQQQGASGRAAAERGDAAAARPRRNRSRSRSPDALPDTSPSGGLSPRSPRSPRRQLQEAKAGLRLSWKSHLREPGSPHHEGPLSKHYAVAGDMWNPHVPGATRPDSGAAWDYQTGVYNWEEAKQVISLMAAEEENARRARFEERLRAMQLQSDAAQREFSRGGGAAAAATAAVSAAAASGPPSGRTSPTAGRASSSQLQLRPRPAAAAGARVGGGRGAAAAGHPRGGRSSFVETMPEAQRLLAQLNRLQADGAAGLHRSATSRRVSCASSLSLSTESSLQDGQASSVAVSRVAAADRRAAIDDLDDDALLAPPASPQRPQRRPMPAHGRQPVVPVRMPVMESSLASTLKVKVIMDDAFEHGKQLQHSERALLPVAWAKHVQVVKS